jgi:MerR family transcriptional regulator, repressor of the yfmOP operon
MDITTKDDGIFLINDVSQRVGLSQKRIREYEKEGFIKPSREPRTNNRRYTQADINQIKHIKRLIHEHGFTLACLKYFITAASCWTIFNCPRKESCPIYKEPHKPCYEVVRQLNVPQETRNCGRCPIYLNRHEGKDHRPALLKEP